MNKKATAITATALSIPLLVGCGQADTEATASPAADSAEGTTSPAAQTAHGSGTEEPAQGTESATPGADPASTATGEQSDGAEQLPAVADPCAGQCTETGRIPVEHPKFGAMEVVTYHEVTSPEGAAPSTGLASYALYQNGQPVGYVGSEDSSPVVFFGTSPSLGGQKWELNNGSNGTMPPGEGAVKTPFSNADLKISEDGEPTVIQKTLEGEGRETGETVNYVWDGQALVPEQ